jgi:hypothetical protein
VTPAGRCADHHWESCTFILSIGTFGDTGKNILRGPRYFDADLALILRSRISAHGVEGNLLAMHTTVKPVQMIADAILDSSARGEIVLDGFFGSGSTLLAAERVGRICYGMEIDTLRRRGQSHIQWAHGHLLHP